MFRSLLWANVTGRANALVALLWLVTLCCDLAAEFLFSIFVQPLLATLTRSGNKLGVTQIMSYPAPEFFESDSSRSIPGPVPASAAAYSSSSFSCFSPFGHCGSVSLAVDPQMIAKIAYSKSG